MEPNFSDAISRFVKKFIKKSAGNSLSRKRTKTAGRVQRRIINDESIENNNFEFENENENSLSQDKTEYLIKQGELVSEKFDLMSSKNFEQEIDQHSKSQFAVDDSYNLKSTSIF